MVEQPAAAEEKPVSAPKVPALSITVPEQEAEAASSEAQQPQPLASGRTSGRGTEAATTGRVSARNTTEGASGRQSGRHSARGGVSARGGAPKTVICHEAVIKGNVTFGEGCIVHPGAQIIAEGGDIIFGDFNIVEEYAKIINQPRKDQQGNVVKRTMRIGNYNLFEVGCAIESAEIGDMNEFGVKSVIGGGCQITTCCVVNPTVQVPPKMKLAPNSVFIEIGVVATDQQFQSESSKKNHIRDISSNLAETIPHHLKTQVKDASGNWQPVEPTPKGNTTGRTANRPGSKQTGGASARGTGQTSARMGSARNATATGAGGVSSRAKLPQTATAASTAATTTTAATTAAEAKPQGQ